MLTVNYVVYDCFDGAVLPGHRNAPQCGRALRFRKLSLPNNHARGVVSPTSSLKSNHVVGADGDVAGIVLASDVGFGHGRPHQGGGRTMYTTKKLAKLASYLFAASLLTLTAGCGGGGGGGYGMPQLGMEGMSPYSASSSAATEAPPAPSVADNSSPPSMTSEPSMATAPPEPTGAAAPSPAESAPPPAAPDPYSS